MNKLAFLVLAVSLASVAFVACRDDADTTEPTATTAPTQAAEPTSAPTAAPTPEPTAVPTPTEVPTPTPEPTPAPEAVMGLSPECIPGGTIDDAATVVSCATQALQKVESFAFEGDLNLLALFPVPGAGAGPEGKMRLSGAVARPDSIRFEISFAPEGQAIEIAGVVIGTDTYIKDPESGLWFKGAPPDADFLSVIQAVGMMQAPPDAPATLQEPVTLDDGTPAYVLNSAQSADQSGMAGFAIPGASLVLTIGADDFLTREVRVVIQAEGGAGDLLTFTYSMYNEAQDIEPPARFMTLPAGPVAPPPMADPMVLGLARNADGDVEVLFSVQVFVEGQVELFVIDPATGGWGLPLLRGSGTNILVFDGDAEGRQTLVAGQHEIAGFTFPTPDSQMTDSQGNRLDLTFDVWKYE